MSINRRQILVGATVTAAVAVITTTAITEIESTPFDIDRFIAFAEAETERLHPYAFVKPKAIIKCVRGGAVIVTEAA